MVKRAGLFLVLVALAGCAGLQAADTDAPSGQDARDGYAAIDAVAGTVEYRFETAERESNTTVSVLTRPTKGLTRQEFLAPDRLAGDLTVTNGSVYWRYDASENAATRTALESSVPANASDATFVRRVFSTLSESGADSVVADPPLPVGPLSAAGGGPDTTPLDLVGPSEFAVEYVGTETVAGREAHVVELDSVNASGEGSASVENATYWFDAEYFLPLKTTSVLSIGGDRTRATQLYRSVSFDPEAAPDRFQFDPPPNATVETQSLSRPETFDTAAAAARSVDFDVATPDVPAGYDLETARVSRFRNRTTVSLRYANATREFSVVTRAPPLDAGLDGRTVALGPVNATALTTRADVTVYRWQCDGLGYTVRGDLAPAAVGDVARGVASPCET